MATKAAPSLQEIFGDTPPEKLDRPCQDEHLCEITRHITDWPALAPFMGITAPEMEEIRGKWPFSVGGQKMEFMRKWKEKHGQKGTYRRLWKAFRKAGKVAVAEKVCDILCSHESVFKDSSDEDEFFDALEDLSSPDLKPQQSSLASISSTPAITAVPSDPLEPLANELHITYKRQTECSCDMYREELMPTCKRVKITSESETDPTVTSMHHHMDPPLPVVHSRFASGRINSLDALAVHLRMTYGSQTPTFIALQWPPPPTLKVFNLALIQSEETVRVQPLDENLIRLTVSGGVDDVMKLKTSIELEDLFQVQGKKRRVVLVEGAPGSGKSTLANDICQKWETRKLFHDQFKVVIYVQFRDLEVQSAQEIADLLPMELLSEQRAAALLLKDCYGEGVLFILDGWDEYSPGLQEGSLFHKLICLPKKLSVQLSTILITSRPSASAKLQKYATSRVEIVGFTPDEVGRYFQGVFKNVTTVKKLYNHLHERPLIKASCYLPLNAAIVAHLFTELNYTLPTTLHGLFSSLVLSCIIRHLTRGSETEPDTMSLDDLPPDVQEDFQKVCVIAYEGAMRNQVIFSSQDLRSYGLPNDFNTLSLMQVVQRIATGKPKSYYFLHLSIQELLAARHIASLPPLEQVRIFTELLDNPNPRFDAIFSYYAALTKLQTEGIRDIVARVVHSVVSSDNEQGESLYLIQLFKCLHECRDPSLCHFVSFQLRGTLKLTSLCIPPFDLLSLKYFLSCVNDSSAGPAGGNGTDSCDVTVSELNLCGCNLTSEDIDSLSLCNLVKLNLSMNTVSCACAANILTNNPQLKEIQLVHCGLTNDGVELFAAALRDHRSLEVLDLRSCTTASASTDFTYGMHQILQATLNHCSLRNLAISHCCVDMKDVAAVSELDLASCNLTSEDINPLSLSNLVKLDFSSNSVSCGCTANILTICTQLKVIRLNRCGLTDDGVELFAAALREHRSLEVLNLSYCYGFTHGMHHILQAIHDHRSLRDLDISHCHVCIKDVAAAIEVTKSLQKLSLGASRDGHGTVVTAIDSLILVDSLRKNETLETLELQVINHQSSELIVWILKDCHLRTLKVRGATLKYWVVVHVNEVRRSKGLPPLIY